MELSQLVTQAYTVHSLESVDETWVHSYSASVPQIRYKGIKLNQYKSIHLKKTTKASEHVRQGPVLSLTCNMYCIDDVHTYI